MTAGRSAHCEGRFLGRRRVQQPHPPIWVGGESPAALRRTVKLGDAWYHGNHSQTKPLDTPQRLRAGIAGLRVVAEAAGRDPASIAVSLIVQNPFEWSAQKVQDGSARRLFTGTSAEMAADAAAIAQTVAQAVAEANARLPDYARIRRWLLADAPFSLANGQWTGTGRPRRQAIWKAYAQRTRATHAAGGLPAGL